MTLYWDFSNKGIRSHCRMCKPFSGCHARQNMGEKLRWIAYHNKNKTFITMSIKLSKSAPLEIFSDFFLERSMLSRVGTISYFIYFCHLLLKDNNQLLIKPGLTEWMHALSFIKAFINVSNGIFHIVIRSRIVKSELYFIRNHGGKYLK